MANMFSLSPELFGNDGAARAETCVYIMCAEQANTRTFVQHVNEQEDKKQEEGKEGEEEEEEEVTSLVHMSSANGWLLSGVPSLQLAFPSSFCNGTPPGPCECDCLHGATPCGR